MQGRTPTRCEKRPDEGAHCRGAGEEGELIEGAVGGHDGVERVADQEKSTRGQDAEDDSMGTDDGNGPSRLSVQPQLADSLDQADGDTAHRVGWARTVGP